MHLHIRVVQYMKHLNAKTMFQVMFSLGFVVKEVKRHSPTNMVYPKIFKCDVAVKSLNFNFKWFDIWPKLRKHKIRYWSEWWRVLGAGSCLLLVAGNNHPTSTEIVTKVLFVGGHNEFCRQPSHSHWQRVKTWFHRKYFRWRQLSPICSQLTAPTGSLQKMDIWRFLYQMSYKKYLRHVISEMKSATRILDDMRHKQMYLYLLLGNTTNIFPVRNII